MALSNTAVPKYYGMFRDAVVQGLIPINQEIELQMNRIDALIADPMYYYDDKVVEGFIAYCEEELTLTDGSDLHLLDSFKLWAEDIFGWYYFVEQKVPVTMEDGRMRYRRKLVKKRLCNKQYLIIARGAAKTMYASCIQSYFLNIDTSTTHTMRQADETLSPIRTSITRARGPLFKFLTEGSLQNTTGSRANRVKLASTKKGIENFLTGSRIETVPMSIDKLQSMRTKIATIDEWLSCDVRENVVGAIEQGSSKIDDYLIVAISSEGTVRNAIGDTIKMQLMKILRGELDQPWVSIWYYKLDSIDDVDNIEKSPHERNDTLAKRFGLPMEGQTYFFSYEEIQVHEGHHDFWKMPCALGGDLSQGDDFCAFTFLFPLSDGSFGVKTRNYISQLTFDKLPAAMHSKYEEFIQEGSLVVMDCTVLDMMQVYDDLDAHMKMAHLALKRLFRVREQNPCRLVS